MTYKEMAAQEINSMPESLLIEILDFIQFIKHKSIKDKTETALASEEVLKKDWLLPEEEEAWANL